MPEIFDRLTAGQKLRAAYRAVFGGPLGQAVLADLARFCGQAQDLHVPGDPSSTAYNCGKDRVFKRIRGYLGTSDAELAERLATNRFEAMHTTATLRHEEEAA